MQNNSVINFISLNNESYCWQ